MCILSIKVVHIIIIIATTVLYIINITTDVQKIITVTLSLLLVYFDFIVWREIYLYHSRTVVKDICVYKYYIIYYIIYYWVVRKVRADFEGKLKRRRCKF